ncbi:MAG: lysophospholipid acyltransferase family protein [Rhodothermales bacterium]
MKHLFPYTFGESVLRLVGFRIIRSIWDIEMAGGGKLADLERPCFVYGNHSHNFDPFIFNMFIPWGQSTRGVLTQEYFRGPIIRKILNDIELRPTRKHVPEPHLIRDIYRMIAAKYAIVIYPEGGRRWDGRPAPWIESTAKVFVKSGIPIYPVVTHGSYTAWPRWASYPRRSKIRVEVKPPLQFDRHTPFEEALALLKAQIDIDETHVPDDLKPYKAYKPAAGIHRLLYRDPVSGANGGVFTKDGTYVENTAGTFRYRMLKDSTLLDEKSGDIVIPSVLYDAIRVLPLDRRDNDAIVRATVVMHSEDQFPRLDAHGEVEIALFPDEIQIKGASINMRLPLEDVLYTGIERNSKLQVFMSSEMLQFTFNGAGSALQWDHSIQRLKAGSAEPASQQARA